MIHIVVNPNSRSGKGKKIWKAIEVDLKSRGIEYEATLTEYPRHAMEIAASLSNDDTALIGVMGGDGSLNEVVNGILPEHSPTIFYIPTGSGNDFARGLCSSIRPDNVAARLKDHAETRFRRLDVGRLLTGERTPERRSFIVSSGIGFDAAVCRDIDQSRVKKLLNKIKLGKLGYLFLGIKNAFTCPLTDATLTIDGARTIYLKNLAFLSAHNLPYEGGGFFFAPKAQPNDGALDLCVVTADSHLRFVFVMLCSFLKGRHIKCKGVHYIRCAKAELLLTAHLPVHTDGEFVGCHDQLTWEVLPNRLHTML